MSDRRVVFIPPNVYCNDYSVAKLTLGAKLQTMSGHEVREQLVRAKIFLSVMSYCLKF